MPPGATPAAHQYAADIDFATAAPSFDLYGGGGLVSTADDLATFYAALFDGEVFDDPNSLETMLDEPDAAGAEDTGMGIFPRRIAREECWGHTGFWGSDVVHCPDAELTIVRSVNQAFAEGLDFAEMEARIGSLVLGD